MAFLSGYDYRRTLYFVKNNVVKSDYQVEINPTEGASAASGKVLTADFQADFDDIRATDGANSVADQWRESYSSGVSAKYWHELNKVGSSLLSANAASGQAVVNVNAGTVFTANDYILVVDDNLLAGELAQIQSISTNALTMTANLSHAFTTAANAKVAHMSYAYYKNASASLSSNGDNTFEFFDDFEGDSLDTNKWTASASISYSVSSSKLHVTGCPTQWNARYGFLAKQGGATYNPPENSFIVEGKDVYWNGEAQTIYVWGILLSDGSSGSQPLSEVLNDDWAANTAQKRGKIEANLYKSGPGSLGASGTAQFKIQEDESSNAQIYWDGASILGPYSSTTNIAELWLLVNKYSSYNYATETSIDRILQRKYVSGLTWGTWGDEESSGETVSPSSITSSEAFGAVTLTFQDITFPAMVARIAFESEPLADTPTWTTVTDDLIFASIKRGRQHEMDRVEASTATIILRNLTGNYYPDKATSDYYPNVKARKRINLRATYRGTTYDLFTGFVESWHPSWLGNGGIGAVMNVTAVGVIKNLSTLLLNNAGYAEEKSGTRIGNVLDDLSWPAGDRDLDTGQSDIQATGALANENAMEHLWTVQESEAGIMFAKGNGDVEFQDRHARLLSPLNTSQATFGDSPNQKLNAINFSRDDSFVFNDVRIKRVGGTEQVAIDSDSQGVYGKISLSREDLLMADDTEALSQADYLLSLYKDDHTRVKSVVVLPQADTTELFPKVLGYDISTRIKVVKSEAGINDEYHIEGIEQNIDMKKKFWQTRWQLSDANSQAYWSIGVAGLSEIGETTKLSY